jgi:hypothetical protein
VGVQKTRKKSGSGVLLPLILIWTAALLGPYDSKNAKQIKITVASQRHNLDQEGDTRVFIVPQFPPKNEPHSPKLIFILLKNLSSHHATHISLEELRSF